MNIVSSLVLPAIVGCAAIVGGVTYGVTVIMHHEPTVVDVEPLAKEIRDLRAQQNDMLNEMASISGFVADLRRDKDRVDDAARDDQKRLERAIRKAPGRPAYDPTTLQPRG